MHAHGRMHALGEALVRTLASEIRARSASTAAARSGGVFVSHDCPFPRRATSGSSAPAAHMHMCTQWHVYAVAWDAYACVMQGNSRLERACLADGVAVARAAHREDCERLRRLELRGRVALLEDDYLQPRQRATPQLGHWMHAHGTTHNGLPLS